MKSRKFFTVRSITLISVLMALISVCAWISIPFSISFTMQSFAIFFIAITFDWKITLCSVSGYLFLGCLGVPVFSGFQGGIGVLLGKSGGYLIGFVIISFLVSMLLHRKKKSRVLPSVAVLIGAQLLCYAFGAFWYYLLFRFFYQTVIPLYTLLAVCVVPFLIPDLIKIFLAFFVSRRVSPRLNSFIEMRRTV